MFSPDFFTHATEYYGLYDNNVVVFSIFCSFLKLIENFYSNTPRLYSQW